MKTETIRSNSKLGKLMSEGREYNPGRMCYEGQKFFRWMFYKGYVTAYEHYETHIWKDNKVDTKWSSKEPITREVLNNYETLVESFPSNAMIWDMEDGTYRLHYSLYYDGNDNVEEITTTSSIKELFKEYEKESKKGGFDLAMYASRFYLPYQTYGDFFEDYGGLTFDEVLEGAEWYDTNQENYCETPDREMLRDILLYKKGKTDLNRLEFGLWLKKNYLGEYVSKEDILSNWEYDIRIYQNGGDKEVDDMKKRVLSDGWLDDVYESINNK